MKLISVSLGVKEVRRHFPKGQQGMYWENPYQGIEGVAVRRCHIHTIKCALCISSSSTILPAKSTLLVAIRRNSWKTCFDGLVVRMRVVDWQHTRRCNCLEKDNHRYNRKSCYLSSYLRHITRRSELRKWRDSCRCMIETESHWNLISMRNKIRGTDDTCPQKRILVKPTTTSIVDSGENNLWFRLDCKAYEE